MSVLSMVQARKFARTLAQESGLKIQDSPFSANTLPYSPGKGVICAGDFSLYDYEVYMGALHLEIAKQDQAVSGFYEKQEGEHDELKKLALSIIHRYRAERNHRGSYGSRDAYLSRQYHRDSSSALKNLTTLPAPLAHLTFHQNELRNNWQGYNHAEVPPGSSSYNWIQEELEQDASNFSPERILRRLFDGDQDQQGGNPGDPGDHGGSEGGEEDNQEPDTGTGGAAGADPGSGGGAEGEPGDDQDAEGDSQESSECSGGDSQESQEGGGGEPQDQEGKQSSAGSEQGPQGEGGDSGDGSQEGEGNSGGDPGTSGSTNGEGSGNAEGEQVAPQRVGFGGNPEALSGLATSSAFPGPQSRSEDEPAGWSPSRLVHEKVDSQFPLSRTQDGINAALGTNTLSKRVKRYLIAKKQVGYEYGKKRGRICPKNIGRLYSGSPMDQPRIFKERNQERLHQDTAVMILGDCSGSMTGTRTVNGMLISKYMISAACQVALSTVLTPLRIPHAMMQFTTSGYNVMQYHMKGFEEKVGKEELIKRFSSMSISMESNSDGESLMYAASVLSARPERRKLLIVLSDGQPAHNGGDSFYLRDVTKLIEGTKGIDLIGIGIRSEAVESYYRRSRVVNDLDKLEEELLEVLKENLLRREG